MFIKYLILCLVLLFCHDATPFTQGKRCNDCQSLLSCPEALKLVDKKDGDSEQRLRNAFCGFGSDKYPKVCCSEFPPSSDDVDLEHHANINLLPQKCGDIDGDKIVGGETAGLYEFPWMVLISHKTRLGVQFECGGTLINDRYVLTAAHCVANHKIAGVRIGENDIRTDTDCQGKPPQLVCESNIQDIRVEDAVSHSEYQTKPNKNDIALLRLKKPVDFSFKNAGAVCLPVSSSLRTRDVGSLNATVAGWGYTENHYFSPILLKVTVPIYTKESCRELYNRGKQPGQPDDTVNKLCAGEVGKDSCGGDSGGPLMVKGVYNGVHRYIQHGIVSYGPTRCGSNFPGVYTDVAKFMKWILDNIKP